MTDLRLLVQPVEEVACYCVLTWNSTVSDIADEVSNLRAISDASWGSMAGRAVKCGNDSRYAFCHFMRVVTELVSERFPAFRFHSMPVIATIIESERYLSYVADWHAYPHESMGHYCRRFQEAMLPHVPQELGSPELQALHVHQEGLPPEIRRLVPAPMAGMTVGNMIDDIMEAEIIAPMMQADAFMDDYQVPVDDAGIGEPLLKAGPVFLEDPIPTVPLQEIPPQEAEADIGADDQNPAHFMVAPDDQPEDPQVIIIDSDDDEEDIEEE
ncbi:hypothetical protein TIFTF001_041600 [Ficus carica]|uniref:Uncharacterized protein n=1 Tax=Ficus carica TaxID=3494 RepID=A0AA88CTX1_FICCA|nr:hypothetical protein TIFTF001_041597 [Ficus carica]GMN31495.1 hypothetical protein TIFTF001_041600 [Ficus carica]